MMTVPTPSKNTVWESIKFGFVGGSGVVVNFIVLSIALYLLHLVEPVALALGILVSMSTNYLLNRVWTFSSENEIGKEYVRYAILNSLGILIQFLIAVGLETYFDSIGFLQIDLVLIAIDTIFLASLTGIVVGFVSNFLFSKYLVFNDREPIPQ